MTDWMGDRGFLVELSFQVRGFNFVGDIQRFVGVVESTQREEDGFKVTCSITSTNQNGQVTGTGSALVALPARR
jgi:hypothetical protein